MFGLLVAATLATALTQASNIADGICYDRAVLGRIRHVENFVDLNNFVQAHPNLMMVGGRWDVDKVLAGNSAPAPIKARAVLTDLFSPKTKFGSFPVRQTSVRGVLCSCKQ